jgi:dipeptidyl aminopeptidase/acylaminoacyl peptidase
VLAVGGAAFTARLGKGGQIVVTPNSSAPNARTYALAADGCQRLAASPTAPVLAIGARNELRLWHFLQAGPLVTIATIDVCRGLAWRADGRAVALVDGSDVVTVFDATSGERLASRTFPEGALGLDCAPQGDAIAVACVDQVVRIWSPTRGLLGNLVGHASHVQAVAYSPDGSRIASGGQDRTVKIFAVDDATELLTLPHHAHVGAVAWSPNGRRLASVDVSGQVKVWDATAGYAANSR